MSHDAPKRIAFRIDDNDKVIVFLHGFRGSSHQTFGNFPAFVLGDAAFADWDVFSIGYPTSLAPDFSGAWSADPDIDSLAGQLITIVRHTLLAPYKRIAFLAHSMGGLVVQRAVLSGDLEDVVRDVLLFGTPSGGLEKARLAKMWKRQVRDMRPASDFMKALREDWTARYASARPFGFWAAWGYEDEFVPRESAHGPFDHDKDVCKSIFGDHLSVVKPTSREDDPVLLVKSFLAGTAPKSPTVADVKQRAEAEFTAQWENARDSADWEAAVRAASFDLEAKGLPDEAITLLVKTGTESSDLKGMLAGRFKRVWLADSSKDEAGQQALDLYIEGLAQAREGPDPDHAQAFYHGVNVAFLRLALLEDVEGARDMAHEVLEHVKRDAADNPGPDMWRAASEGEARLYLSQAEAAIERYTEALDLGPDARQRTSMGRQAVWVARLLDDGPAEGALFALFTGL